MLRWERKTNKHIFKEDEEKNKTNNARRQWKIWQDDDDKSVDWNDYWIRWWWRICVDDSRYEVMKAEKKTKMIKWTEKKINNSINACNKCFIYKIYKINKNI